MEMLRIFMEFEVALSANDIIENLSSKRDRVTIYRALNSFEKKGIIHRASVDEKGVKYAICGNQCPNEYHADRHVHFTCNRCHQTYCLEHVEIPEVPVSEKFSIDHINYTLSGICKICNA